MPKGQRLDIKLIELGLFASREAARAAIMDGGILVNNEKVTKAGVSVAEYAAVLLVFTDDGPVTASVNKLVMVIVPVPLFEGSATLMAVKEMFGAAARMRGAVYVPEESTVPHAAPGHPMPKRTQVTFRLGFPAELTVAVNGCEAPSGTCMV